MATSTKRRKTQRVDIYAQVTNRIIEQLEQGVRPWLKPWHAEHAAGRITRPLRHNLTPYSGINILMLWASAQEQGFATPIWLTFKQVKELGGNVCKGSKGSPVVFASTFKRSEESEAGDEVEKDIPFLKQYTVFNAEQCEGLPSHFHELETQTHDEPLQPIQAAKEFFSATGATIKHGGNRACYSMASDHICMPDLQTFTDAESYSAILAHEVTHWTRHPSRLARDLGRKRWGDEGYAMEELVAELGSAFLCADLGITPEVRDDHASYIASWLEVLKRDKRAVFSAASMASRAVDYVHSLQPALAAAELEEVQ
ncbi:MAG: zincin-like metallopeptidase domain-containing protein [Aureliella sp.]